MKPDFHRLYPRYSVIVALLLEIFHGNRLEEEREDEEKRFLCAVHIDVGYYAKKERKKNKRNAKEYIYIYILFIMRETVRISFYTHTHKCKE